MARDLTSTPRVRSPGSTPAGVDPIDDAGRARLVDKAAEHLRLGACTMYTEPWYRSILALDARLSVAESEAACLQSVLMDAACAINQGRPIDALTLIQTAVAACRKAKP